MYKSFMIMITFLRAGEKIPLSLVSSFSLGFWGEFLFLVSYFFLGGGTLVGVTTYFFF